MRSAQILSGRTSRWLFSSMNRGNAFGLYRGRCMSCSIENPAIATASTATMTPTSSRRRQRPTAIAIPSILSHSFVGGRYYSTSDSGNNLNSKSSNRNDSVSPPTSTIDCENSSIDDVGATGSTNLTKGTTGVSADNTTSDPSMVTWVDDYLPAYARPYAHLSRMDKPIGTWLLLWPCFWSTAMAAGVSPVEVDDTKSLIAASGQFTTPTTLMDVLPDPKLLGLFTIGAFVMRGAGCTINDLWDRDLDSQVTRTKNRPLAAGILTPTQAVGWLAAQLAAGLVVLVSLPHTEYCFWWGASSLPIVVAYPLMKRFFDYPQLVLGLCFNWGAFMGWAAVHGTMDYHVVLPLYASGVAWTIGYDTLYAHQDKDDDAKLGLKSTAISFGKFGKSHDNSMEGTNGDEDRHKRVLYGFAAVTYASWMLAGYNNFVGSPGIPFGAYGLGITGAYTHLLWQIQTADLSNPHNLAERFRSNAKVGGIVFGSILAGKLAMLV